MPGFRLTIALLLSGCVAFGGCKAHQGTTTVSKSDDTTVTSAGSGKLPKVVIKEFTATGISKDEVSGVSGKFCVEVSKSRKIDLVCAEDLKNLFQHQQDLITFGACEQEECLAKMGAQLQADFILQGAINQVGEVFMVNVNLVNGKTGSVKTRFSREVSSGKTEDLLDAMTVLAEKIRVEF